MTRSKRKTPITGMTLAESDKAFKAAEHRRQRAAVREALAHEADPPGEKAFGNPWKGEKDGKQWLGDRHPKLMRK